MLFACSIWKLFLLVVAVVGGAWGQCRSAQKILSDSAKFKLSSCDGNLGPFLPSSIPVEVHTELIKAGVINADPYFRFEEKNVSWVASMCWMFTSELFDIGPLSHSKLCDLSLEFESLDAVADVYLNNFKLGSSRNAHKLVTFTVPHDFVQDKGNFLQIRLLPALDYAKKQASLYPYSVPATENYNVWAEPTSRNFLRKAGSDFGWDWGPAFVQTGIYGSITLYQSQVTRLQGFTVHQHLADDLASVVLSFKVALKGTDTTRPKEPLTSSVYLNDDLVCTQVISHPPPGLSLMDVGQVALTNPILWWPKGFGAQHLYTLRVELSDGQSLTRRIGIRKAELVQNPLNLDYSDAYGEHSFYVRINNVPIYILGANFIPIDSFTPRISDADRRYIFETAMASNMNMLRVWGGGIYQHDHFYDLADEYGIMIWQEVMLACALYPRDAAFLKEIEEEVTQQAVRLNTHASVVVWGGNNENEVAMSWFQQSQLHRDVYIADYTELYGNTAYPAINRVYGGDMLQNTQAAWVDSSPSNGLLSADPYVKKWGQASTAVQGDVHYYNYACDCEDASTYPEAKFVSEFGFQSMPSFLSYEPVSSVEDWQSPTADSPLFQYRQRHEDGNSQMEEQVSRHFSLPASCPSAQRNLDMYLYLNTIQQSRCYETAILRWRQLRGPYSTTTSTRTLESVKGGQTMGILYWQLNDIWQGPSWSSMEYAGRWKPLQYTVRRVYEPFLLGVLVQNDTVSASLSNHEVLVQSDVNEAPGKRQQVSIFVVNDDFATSKSATTSVRVTVELVSWQSAQAVELVVSDLSSSYGSSTSLSNKGKFDD